MANLSDFHTLASTSLPSDSPQETRTFTLWEMTKYILPVSLSHLRKMLRENKALPAGVTDKDRATRHFSAQDIQTLWGQFPSLDESLPKTIAVISHDPEASSGLASLLSVRAALAGHQAHLVDLGATGHATQQTDKTPDVGPAVGEIGLAQSAAAAHLKANRLRADLGEPPITLPIGLDRYTDHTLEAEPTKWPGLTLSPGGQLAGLALDWAFWQRAIPRWTGEDALDEIVSSRNTLTFIDAGHEPGPLMIAALRAADLLLIADPGGGEAWFSTLKSRLDLWDEKKASAAAALGETHQPLSWQAIRRVPTTDESPVHPLDLPRLSPAVLPKEGTFWDIIPRSMPRADYVELRAAPEALWQAVLKLVKTP